MSYAGEEVQSPVKKQKNKAARQGEKIKRQRFKGKVKKAKVTKIIIFVSPIKSLFPPCSLPAQHKIIVWFSDVLRNQSICPFQESEDSCTLIIQSTSYVKWWNNLLDSASSSCCLLLEFCFLETQMEVEKITLAFKSLILHKAYQEFHLANLVSSQNNLQWNYAVELQSCL